MELEFELEPEPTRRWLEEKDEGRAIERTKFFALQLEALLNLCIPGIGLSTCCTPSHPLYSLLSSILPVA